MTWIVYGLLENREDDHDLRFLEREIEDLHAFINASEEKYPDYEAFAAFPEWSVEQWSAGTKIVPGAGAMAMLGMGSPCSWAPPRHA